MAKALAAKIAPVTKASGAPGQPVATRESAHAVAAAIMGEAGPSKDHIASRETPRPGRYVVRRVNGGIFGYCGAVLSRGQVFELRGLENDKRLVDLGYVVALESGASLSECGVCGGQFVSIGMRDGHAASRHAPRRFVPPAPPVRDEHESGESYQNRLDEWAKAAGAMADAQDDRSDKAEDQLAPLDLTRTQASRGA